MAARRMDIPMATTIDESPAGDSPNVTGAVFLRRIAKNERGQDLVEYALLTLFVSLFVMAAVQTTGAGVTGLWEYVSGQLAVLFGA